MNEIIPTEEQNIENMIYEIRGKQVMLDSDLAKLYQVETKRVNEAVKNNPEKFPERFAWKLTKEELLNLRSKISTSSLNNYGGRRYLPRVFTEQGVAMLATILKSKKATDVSIRIMDAFVEMRHFIVENKDIYQTLTNINNKLIEHDKKIDYLFSIFDKKEHLFLPGTEYDAYREITKILKAAKEEIIIIDGYVDVTLLDIIKELNTNVVLITKNKNNLKKIEIDKYNNQYNNLQIIKNDTFHDRYIILDNKEIYHIGTSLNHAGKRVFSINKLEDKIIIDNLLNYIKTIID